MHCRACPVCVSNWLYCSPLDLLCSIPFCPTTYSRTTSQQRRIARQVAPVCVCGCRTALVIQTLLINNIRWVLVSAETSSLLLLAHQLAAFMLLALQLVSRPPPSPNASYTPRDTQTSKASQRNDDDVDSAGKASSGSLCRAVRQAAADH